MLYEIVINSHPSVSLAIGHLRLVHSLSLEIFQRNSEVARQPDQDHLVR
jgi:hypothetical protein